MFRGNWKVLFVELVFCQIHSIENDGVLLHDRNWKLVWRASPIHRILQDVRQEACCLGQSPHFWVLLTISILLNRISCHFRKLRKRPEQLHSDLNERKKLQMSKMVFLPPPDTLFLSLKMVRKTYSKGTITRVLWSKSSFELLQPLCQTIKRITLK